MASPPHIAAAPTKRKSTQHDVTSWTSFCVAAFMPEEVRFAEQEIRVVDRPDSALPLSGAQSDLPATPHANLLERPSDHPSGLSHGESHDAVIEADTAGRRNGDHDIAIAEFTKAIELRPDAAEAFYGRGLAYQNKNAFSEAVVDFTRAIELDPVHADALFRRSIAHRLLGAFDQASADFDRAVQILWRHRETAKQSD